VAWVRENLFNGPLNTVLTLIALFLLYRYLPPIVQFSPHGRGLDRNGPCRVPGGHHRAARRRLLGLCERAPQLFHLRLVPRAERWAG
jgi:hypothetical protein